MRPLVEAARPRTLPAAVAPVLVGTAAATRPLAELVWTRAALALVVALSLQVAVNYANDLFDGLRGVDTEARVGPRRAVATGLVTPRRMRDAMIAALAVAAVAGLVLAWVVAWELLLVGVLAILAALGYSGGPRPYASAGLGEVFVFVFFGLVATVGSAYVQDEAVTLVAGLAGIAMGCFATALLVVNNLRDIPSDEAVGKVTLAVRLGEGGTRTLYVALVGGAYAVLAAMVVATGEGWLALAALSLVVAWKGLERVRHAPLGPQLITALEHTAKAQLLYAVLLTAGFVLAGDLGTAGVPS
jgi:1,4-dihydroxy-2-naphthoate polyprenyltransferase